MKHVKGMTSRGPLGGQLESVLQMVELLEMIIALCRNFVDAFGGALGDKGGQAGH